MHLVADLEDVRPEALANFSLHAAQLLQVVPRGRLHLREVSGVGFADLAGLHLPETYLDGLVAVFVGGADGGDDVRLYFQDGYANERAIILEGLGHMLLSSENCRCHNL